MANWVFWLSVFQGASLGDLLVAPVCPVEEVTNSFNVVIGNLPIDPSHQYWYDHFCELSIAQWENERISLPVFSVGRVMMAQWENECITLPVLSMARVMIAHREKKCIYLTVCPSCGPGSIPSHGGVLPPEPAWQKMA